jgi:hypothetical protein
MIKNQTKLIDLDTELVWNAQRTRGVDIDNGPLERPTQTWILILTDSKGERRFIPEGRVFEWYRTIPVE